MPSKANTLPGGVIRLAQLVSHLRSAPRPTLNTVRSLRIYLAKTDDHAGAKKFVKEELPRIRYANPDLGIEVRRKQLTTKEAPFRPTMDVVLADGTKRQLNLHKKNPATILRALLKTANVSSQTTTPAPAQAKTEAGENQAGATSEGTPASDSAEKVATPAAAKVTYKLPTLNQWQRQEAQKRKEAGLKKGTAQSRAAAWAKARYAKLKAESGKDTTAKESNTKDKKASSARSPPQPQTS